jgi:hypothetical protein
MELDTLGVLVSTAVAEALEVSVETMGVALPLVEASDETEIKSLVVAVSVLLS